MLSEQVFVEMKLLNSSYFRNTEKIFYNKNEEMLIHSCTYGASLIEMTSFPISLFEQQFEKQMSNKEKISSKIENVDFPFNDLPATCKLQVFSYLNTSEKGKCRTVCREWEELLNCSCFWKTVDLDFLLHKGNLNSIEMSSNVKKKLISFVNLIDSLEVKIKSLKFDLEICLGSDIIDCLLRSESCSDLLDIEVTWKNLVPASFREMNAKSEIPRQDLAFQRRRQQRQAAAFLDNFVQVVPKIEKLVIPFDWTLRSASALSSLRNLKILVLNKQSELQPPEQSSLDVIFSALKNLEYLDMEAYSPNVCGYHEVSIKSLSLKHLNVSRSKGICLSGIKVPQLLHLKISRSRWTCPLSILAADETTNQSCLYSILRSGAPKLLTLNEHTLKQDWALQMYPELETIMTSVCPCAIHDRG